MVAVDDRGAGQGAPTKARLRRRCALRCMSRPR